MAGDVKIRPGDIGDLDSLLALEVRGFDSDRFDLNHLRYLILKAKSTILVAEIDGEIVGSAIMIWRDKARSGRLYSIVIDPSIQKRGIGGKLMEACESETFRHGRDSVTLEVRADNKNAISFYQKLGYKTQRTLTGYYSDGVSGLKMKKDLQSARPERMRLKVPYYAQTLKFTCGPACMMMAFKYFNPGIKLDRKMEMTLWKEATLIYTTSGMGGCGPFGMALSARRRGFSTKVILSAEQPPFFSSVRQNYKRKIIRLVHEDMKAKGLAIGVQSEVYDFTFDEIADAMYRGYIPIVLISTYRLHGDRAPHWVTLTGYDKDNVFFHDSYEGFYEHVPKLARNIPFAITEFNEMRRYGKDLYKSVVLIGPQDMKPKVAIDGGDL